MKYGSRCIGTTSNIKITKDEAMSAHESNDICAFLLLMTFKVHFFSELKYQQRLQQKTCRQFLPSSMRAANPNELKCRLATSGNFIGNVIFIIEIIIKPNAME